MISPAPQYQPFPANIGYNYRNIHTHMQRNIVKRLGVWSIFVALVLMIPLIFSWPWTGSDFVFGAVMLFGSAALYEFLTRKMISTQHRIAVGAAVFLVLAVLWVMAATG